MNKKKRNAKHVTKKEEYLNLFVELRKSKGLTYEEAKATALGDYMYYACLMVKAGDADGVVSGACHSTANTLRPGLQIIKTAPGVPLVSSYFLMIAPECGNQYCEDGCYIYADCGLEQNPDSSKLAAIAASSADSFNYYLFDGKQVIQSDKLQVLDPTEMALIPKDTTVENVEKIRDVLKQCVLMADDKATYLMLGIENQTDVHYALPVKNMIYDALNYGKQVLVRVH